MYIKLSIICIITLTIGFKFSNGIHIHPDGGYDISIGCDFSLSSEDDILIDNIEFGIRELSNQLFASTNKRFYIKSAKFVIPLYSNFNSSSVNSTTGYGPSYENSDFRITSPTSFNTSSRVENGNKCGEAGEFIELNRDKFFGEDEAYGSIDKVLLKLWARYRWGVYEEHGHPMSSAFPYFHRRENKWEVTGCSNQPLIGTIVGPGNCDVNGENRPSQGCTFQPNNASTSSSSLMHFHWVDSVVEFCDENTHDKLAPTRQNLYCGKRSVWEVMRETKDFKAAVDPPLEDLPDLEFSVVQLVERPHFHILIDQGVTDYHGGIPQAIHIELIKALENVIKYDEDYHDPNELHALNNKLVTISSYGVEQNSDEITEVLPFTILNRANIMTFIDKLHIDIGNGSVERDFSKAIKQLGESIREMDHSPGSVVLIVKTGSGTSELRNLAEYEEEIMSLFRIEKTIVFAIEIGGRHLKNLAEASEGIHLRIDSVIGAHDKIKNVLDELPYILNQRDLHFPERENLRKIMSQSVEPNVDIQVPEGVSDLTGLSIRLTTPANLLPNDISFGEEFFNQRLEYDSEDSTARFVYFANPKTHPKQPFRFRCTGAQCVGRLTVEANYDSIEHEDIKVTLSTSSDIVDYDAFNKTNFNNDELLPFTIFVKVTKDGRPVNNAIVKAIGTNDALEQVMNLNDNGDAFPDIAKNDGIYSGIFLPQANGEYSISATVSNGPSTATKGVLASQSVIKNDVFGSGFVIPIDQDIDSFPCEIIGSCFNEQLEGNYHAVVEYPVEITVQNIEKNPIGIPDKIEDFKVDKIEEADRNVIVTFVAPHTFGIAPESTEYNYIFYFAKSQEDVDNGRIEPFLTSENSLKPGEIETYELPHKGTDGETIFYVVGAKEATSNILGMISNSIEVRIGESPATTESPTTAESPATTESPTTAESPTTTKKPWLRTTGGILTIIGILVAVLLAVGVGYFYQKKKKKSTVTV